MIKKYYFALDKLENAIHSVLKTLGGTLLGVAFLSIFLQVLYRFLISKMIILPLAWTEELSRFCMFWIIYLMLPVTIKEGLESTNTFLSERLQGMAKMILFIVVRLICLFVVIMALRYSFTVISTNWSYSSPAMHLPGIVMYVPVTVGMVLVLMRYTIEFLGILCKERAPFESVGVGGVE